MITRLDWDSAHFGVEMYRVEPPVHGITIHGYHAEAVRDAFTENARLLFRRLSGDAISEIRVLESLGYRLADNMLTLRGKMTSYGEAGLTRPMCPEDLPQVRSLIRGAFPQSRFAVEPALRERADGVYEAMLERFPHGRVIEDNGVIGFTAWKAEGLLGDLGLFCVRPEDRGHGYGPVLLLDTKYDMAQAGCLEIEAATWVGSPALHVYQGAGMRVTGSLMSFYLDLGGA